MNLADIIIIAVIATLFVLAILKRRSDKQKGKGCCGGASCNCCTNEKQNRDCTDACNSITKTDENL